MSTTLRLNEEGELELNILGIKMSNIHLEEEEGMAILTLGGDPIVRLTENKAGEYQAELIRGKGIRAHPYTERELAVRGYRLRKNPEEMNPGDHSIAETGNGKGTKLYLTKMVGIDQILVLGYLGRTR